MPCSSGIPIFSRIPVLVFRSVQLILSISQQIFYVHGAAKTLTKTAISQKRLSLLFIQNLRDITSYS